MELDTEVEVRAGGKVLTGWLAVEIQDGVDQLASRFSLALPGGARPGSPAGRRWPVNPGDAVSVSIGRDLVVSGFADAVQATRDAEREVLKIHGRSRIADLADCSDPDLPRQYLGLTLSGVAAELAKPFGVRVRGAGGAATRPIDRFELGVDEKVGAAIQRLVRLHGVVAHAAPDGSLVIGDAADGKAEVALRNLEGPDGEPDPLNNLLETDWTFDHQERFSRIVVKGQNQGIEGDHGVLTTGIKAESRDPHVGRHRPLVLLSEGQTDAAKAQLLADWERSRRLGKSTKGTVTLAGWRQRGAAGPIWRPGLLVPVRDSVAGLHREMMVSEIAWTFDGQRGRQVKLTLEPPESYAPKPAALASDIAKWGAMKAALAANPAPPGKG